MLLMLLSCLTEPTPHTELPPTGCGPAAPEIPACGSGPLGRGAVLAGEGDADFDAALADAALRRDRQAVALAAWPTGAAAELEVQDAENRALIENFLADHEAGWDFATATGLPPDQVVSQWWKVAGAYAGVAFAADAYRYAVLRDQGAPCAEVEQARAQVAVALESLHLAQELTGVEGVIARGYARSDLPGAGTVELTPLFDDQGNPLPTEKNNGTWRADNSGKHPDMVWEDSCSRDQYIGWIVGMAAIWEVIQADPTFPEATKDRLQADARALGRSLMQVQESGYDLEIRDADGRMTYHGLLSEQSLDRTYVPGFRNGMNAVMVLGIVSSLAVVAEDADLSAWLDEALIAERDLPGIVRDELALQINLGKLSNFSNYNMAFLGGWLALRYLCDVEARSAVATGLAQLYQRDGAERQPVEQDQALYDWVFALSQTSGLPWGPVGDPDAAAVAKVQRVLSDMPPAPLWDVPVENCDAAEVAALSCTLLSGAEVELFLDGEDPISLAPVPMSYRPRSNYYWRSNPYSVNSTGTGTNLYPTSDFRFVYWSARFVRR
jgi:hypothetical protein